jgi:hypothetical protein
MADDSKIHITLPSPEAASAERLAEAFRAITRQLAAQGMHAPHLAEALRAAATEADKIAKEGPIADFGGANVAWHDTVARQFNIGFAPDVPEYAALLFETMSAKEVRICLHVADLRKLGERMLDEARKLAMLAATKEGHG